MTAGHEICRCTLKLVLFWSTVKVEGAPCRVSGRWQGENIPCNRCGPGGWPGPHLFLDRYPGSPYALGAALPIVCSPAPNICTSPKIDIPWFRVLFAQAFFTAGGAVLASRQVTSSALSAASSRLLDAFHKPRKFSYFDFSEVLIHSSRMTGTKLRRTFMAPASN